MEKQLTVEELLKNTDDIEELMAIVENGHPSIDKDHFCWKAIKKLQRMSEKRVYKLYEEIHSI